MPVDAYTQHLRQHLEELSPRPGDEPVVVVLTPGVYNSAYYEHVLLASPATPTPWRPVHEMV